MLDFALKEVSAMLIKEDKFDLKIFCYCVVSLHVLLLRGNEGLMLNLETTKEELQSKRSHCIAALRGR